MTLLERIRMRARERRERREAERVRRILAGECVCLGWDQGGSYIDDPECPQMPQHLAEWMEYRTWECRACGRRVMVSPRRGPAAVCLSCGSTRGWHPSTTEAMTEQVRAELEATYGAA